MNWMIWSLNIKKNLFTDQASLIYIPLKMAGITKEDVKIYKNVSKYYILICSLQSYHDFIKLDI